jgi:hypothetical protein
MVYTSMSETVRADLSARKRRLMRIANPNVSATIGPVRDPRNPVKVRADIRARQLGLSLPKIYKSAGVSRNYLDYEPKTGWREDRLRAVANELRWSVDELLYGPEHEQQKREAEIEAERAAEAERAERERQERELERRHSELLEIAIEIAVGLLKETPEANDGPNVGRLSRMIYESLQLHHGGGELQPSEQSLRIWGRLLMAALTSRSMGS